MKVFGLALALFSFLTGSGCQQDLDTCDITERSCQESIYYTLLALRGDGYDPFGGLPPIRVITEDEFRANLIAAATKSSSKLEDAWDEAFSLLHLYPPQNSDGGSANDGDSIDPRIDDEATHVYAYFRPKERDITLVSHPGGTRVAAQKLAMASLAHELVHALQDRELDLHRSFSSLDEYLADKAVLEGDARFYELLFENKLYSLKLTPSLTVQATHKELSNYLQHFDKLGSPFFAATMLVYPLGSNYLAKIWEKGGNAAVRRAYQASPTTTMGFLTSLDGTPPRGVFRPMTCNAPGATGLKVIGKDRFGALVFFTFLHGWNVPQDLAYSTAQGWIDDQILVFQNQQTQDIGVSWRIVLDQPLAPSISEQLTSTGELQIVTRGNSLEITAETAGSTAEWNSDRGCP